MSRQLLYFTKHLLILAALSLTAFAAFAVQPAGGDVTAILQPTGTAPVDTQEFLKMFHANPRKAMFLKPAHVDPEGRMLDANDIQMYSSVDKRKAALIWRDEIRKQVCQQAGIDCEPKRGTTPNSAPDSKNSIESFTNVPLANILRNPAKMEEMNLMSHVLENAPWSDSFWPVAHGYVARRWADPGFPDNKDWATNFSYIQARPASSVPTEDMSPTEKYDLLVGDSGWRLTSHAWAKGTRYIQEYGFVPSWVGICHGWSPAALMTPMAVRQITVTGYNGQPVKFYPSDVKALASELWGDAPPIVRFAGGRCKKFNPVEDDVGRVTSEGCYDVNPGTFHMAMVNELGQLHRGFVMDATWDFEVWNQPVAAYSYTYFNPQTLQVSDKIQDAMIPASQFTIDKFKKYRGTNVHSYVGIVTDFTYAAELRPQKNAITKQKYHTVRYVYDLELDADGNIVGGEWYSNFHPDFLWNPPVGSRAMAEVEKNSAVPLEWDGTGPVGDEIHRLAQKASAKGQPMAAVVERLIQMASVPDETTGPISGVDTSTH